MFGPYAGWFQLQPFTVGVGVNGGDAGGWGGDGENGVFVGVEARWLVAGDDIYMVGGVEVEVGEEVRR